MKTTNSAEFTIAYSDGSLLMVDRPCLIDTVDHSIRPNINKRIVDVRLVLDPEIGEEVLMALRTGQVAIEISGAKTLVERCL